MFERLRRAGRRLLGPGPATERREQPSPTVETGEPVEPVHPRVLLIVHNPRVESEGDRRLTDIFSWNDPDDLAQAYIADLQDCSGGYLDYQIVERIDADWFPVKQDGFRYTGESYVRAWRSRTFHQPDAIDYQAQVRAFDLLARYERGEIDEVWFFAFPYSGDYESTMAGRNAFWLNSPPIPSTASIEGRLVIMAFNYERDVGCMLENFCHRAESTMSRVYERLGDALNMWRIYTLYDRVAPGRAQCGNAHFAPNSERDYDWGNPRPVISYCDDWYHYPDLPRQARVVTAGEWGGGDMRAHHKWWLRHIPRAAGETDGVANNWWRYIANPNLVP